MGDMPMPQRTAEHDKLNFMVGEWKTREVFPPGPMAPQGGTGEGTTTIKWKVGSMVLTNDYRSKGFMGQAFEGFGLYSYDPMKKEYLNYWFDTMASAGMVSRGRFEGTDLIFLGENETPGGKMKFRMVTHPVSKDEFTFTIHMDIGGKMTLMMTVTHVRG